jgi:hypothetical protein
MCRNFYSFLRHLLSNCGLHYQTQSTYKQNWSQAVGHWTSKADYTGIDFRGTVPRNLVTTSKGVEIHPSLAKLPQSTELPNLKEAGAVIPTLLLIKEIQKTMKDSRQQFFPLSNVMAIVRYTTQFTLRSAFDSVPADATQWPDPPHVEFANCTFESPGDVKRFVEEYGFSAGMIHEHPPKYTQLDLSVYAQCTEDYGFDLGKIYDRTPQKVAISMNRLQQDQVFLRRHWNKTAQPQPVKQHFLWSPNDVNFINGKAKIVISDIWDYILVLFLIDLSKRRLRVCANPSCKRLKYFVQERRDQKYCSTSCKNYVGMHNYLADTLKRKEWNAARRKAANRKHKITGGHVTRANKSGNS